MNCFFDNSTSGIAVFPDSRATCPPGFYCPKTLDKDTSPRVCPPSPECVFARLSGTQCQPQGPLEPVVCPSGFYCPTFQQKIECPEGYYCPIGTVDPIKCTAISACPSSQGVRQIIACSLLLLL